jgi:sn-glycerol 3-phosphate transport system substrate-binding protein
VTIKFWESSAGANTAVLKNIVDAFNKSQNQITVVDVNQTGGYQYTLTQFQSSLNDPSTTPDVVYGDDYTTQAMLDTKAVTPVATCIAQTKTSVSDFDKKAIIQQSIDGKLIAMPYSESAPVLYYDLNAFKKAGIKAAPKTIDQMATDAHLLSNAGFKDGMALKNDPWWLQIYLGQAGLSYVNNGNGHSSRATAVTFNNATAKSLLGKLQTMVANSDAKTFSATGTGFAAFNNLIDIGNGKAGMTFDTSAALATVYSQIKFYYPNVKLGVAPLPLLASNQNKGVQPGGNSLFITSQGGDAKVAAAWKFIQYLTSAENMATWDAGTGYVPARSLAVKTKTITNLWKANPYYKIAYTEINTGGATNNSAGPSIGDYFGVNTAVANALATILDNPSSSVTTQLNLAESNANAAITANNNLYK